MNCNNYHNCYSKHTFQEEILLGICSFLQSSQEYILDNSYENYEDLTPVSPSDICVSVSHYFLSLYNYIVVNFLSQQC